MSEDVGIVYNDKEGLSFVDCDIEFFWVVKEVKGMFFVEFNYFFIGSNLIRNYEKYFLV